MAEYLIVACSLRPHSRSRILAEAMAKTYQANGADVELIDLRDYPLPLCDGDAAYSAVGVEQIQKKIQSARVILLAVPIYNFDVNSAAKNLVELTGEAWENKIVGFLCAAGGEMSFMSIVGLANSLMLDFRCIILPRFVYAIGADFAGDKLHSEGVLDRIARLARESSKVRVEE
jgi:FMN reductase